VALENRLHRSPTDAEFAQQLGITTDELHQIFNQISFVSVVAWTSCCRSAPSAATGSAKIVITLYSYEGLTLAEIGRVLGVTESRVCQLHQGGAPAPGRAAGRPLTALAVRGRPPRLESLSTSSAKPA
jgi:DNA-directed RNA polymerase specialized sigma subunit